MFSDRLKIGVVGAGKMGTNHARVLGRMPGAELVAVADVQAERARTLARDLRVTGFTDYRYLRGNVDGVIVAVPPASHFEVASFFLRSGIPTLIEKPLARTVKEGRRLVGLADKQMTLLQVGHIERYNPAYCSFKESPFCTGIDHILAIRCVSYDQRAQNVGAIIDLMVHDIDLVLALKLGAVQTLLAWTRQIHGFCEDEAYANLVFSKGCVANLFVSRNRPSRGRIMRISSRAGTAYLDFTRRSVAYNPERDGSNFQTPARSPDSSTDGRSPLDNELSDFIIAIRYGARPRVTAAEAIHSLELAERIRVEAGSHTRPACLLKHGEGVRAKRCDFSQISHSLTGGRARRSQPTGS
jgi:predicted dehydrogenase